MVSRVSPYYGKAFNIVMIGSSILKKCVPVNRDVIIVASQAARKAAMYTQGHDRTWIESANQIKLPIMNNAQGVIAVAATCGLIIVRVATNSAALPTHFKASQ